MPATSVRLAAAPVVRPSVDLMPTAALVLGSDYRALGLVRSLGRRGVPVHVLAFGDDRLATYSRYARSTSAWPEDGEERQLLLLEELAGTGHRWAIFPSADESAAFVARNHEFLSRSFHLTTPRWEVLRWAYDKRRTYELAAAAGVEYPVTVYPRDRAHVERLPIRFPVVLKPTVKPEINRLTAEKAWRVDNRESLLVRYDEACQLVEPSTLMVQEVVEGGGDAQLAYAALVESGVVLHSLVARRTRQYPADFGRASTFVETIEDPGIDEPSRRLLESAGFTGMIEVEYKVEPASGRPLLLDMNPRVWGWQSLCARAGVDFPWLQWLQLCGEEPPVTRPRAGVRWLRLSTDLPMAIKEICSRRLSLRAYLKSLRPPHERAVFAPDDPVPGLMELPMILRTLARRRASGEAF